MVPHLRADARAGVGRENDIGGLVGEVAVDALSSQRPAAAREETAALDLVTGEATGGEVFDVALWRVDVVTRRTGHVGRFEAFAAFEQLDRVAVNVKRFVGLW